MSSSEFQNVYGFGVTLGSLYIDTQGYVPALLESLHGMSCSRTYSTDNKTSRLMVKGFSTVRDTQRDT